MSRYVITITGDENGAVRPDAAQTTVKVDTSTGQTRITELTVRAGGDGLAPGDLPPLDLDLLVRALTAPRTAPALEPSAPTARVGLNEAVAERAAEHGEFETAPAAETTPRRRGRAAKPAAGRGRAGRGAAASTGRAKKTTAKAARRSGGGQKSADGSRPYRRMPDAAEVLAAYESVGTITGLAAHFDVPRYTANSWARTLRQQGHAIGRP